MNREIIQPSGAGIYPLTGDVTSTAGNALVAVTGLQGTPVAVSLFSGGEILEYNINTNQWTPTLRASIQVDNVTVSDDYLITVDLNNPITVDGV